MKKDAGSRIKPGDNSIDENILREKANESPESAFFLSTQSGSIAEKVKEEEIIEQTKGEVKIDENTDFFLSEFPLSNEDNE
jgi:hypothetical protein